MITDWFMNWFNTQLGIVAAQLPTTDPFQNVGSWGLWSVMDYFLPVHELVATFGLFFLLGGPMGVISLAVWFFVGVIRGGATKA